MVKWACTRFIFYSKGQKYKWLQGQAGNMNEGSSLGVANWGTPTQFRGVALTDLLRKGRNLNFYLNSQF